MIDVTVKTLDSQNHKYSVPDDITVKQFKTCIAASVNIPPDKQRLIYCGRVLQDEKNLAEYNVHEKVIHLVMRAPPQPSNLRGERRSNPSSSNTSAGTHFRHRATTTQGPSSSGVRLQQAKTMLDKAAELLTQLEEAAAAASPSRGEPSTSLPTQESPLASSSPIEPMEASSSSSAQEGASSRPQGRAAERTEQRQNQSPAEELDILYQEMDALNNMDPPMVEGTHVMSSAMGSPLFGAISNSLQGGLFQAASAAFVSALSSMGVTPTTTSASTVSQSPTASPTSSTTAAATTLASSPTVVSSSAAPAPAPAPTPTVPASSASSGPTQPSPGQAREGPPSSGNPLSGVRGITVRITNRGSQRNSGIPLEHPRCSVMVEVLDQYQEVHRRLDPFVQQYYRSMVDDRTYDGDNDRQLQLDQLLLWRVSAALHYLSHALHAISDIIIDLRRTPPRQLRARPFIIPQPALVQAQINVAPSSDGPHHTRVVGRSGSASTPSTSGSSSTSVETTSTTTPPSTTTTGGSTPTANQGSASSRSYVSMSEYLDEDNGLVFMHVSPSGITIDSLTPEANGADGGANPPPEFIQNLMSSITSQLGMRLGTPSSVSSSSTSGSTTSTSSSPPSTPSSVRRAAPMHNSQAAGNSGTSTTNATQTRVTPRAQQVHVTPLHVPGMGMSQFDPFLPCQSHHIRPSTRRRHRATIQTASGQEQSDSQESEESAPNQESSTHQMSSEAPSSATSNVANANHLSLFANFLAEIVSSGRGEDQQSGEEQQQQQMIAQLVRDVMAEVSGTIAGQGDGSRGSQQPQTSLREFLEPFSGGGFFSEGEQDSIFAHLFTTVSQSLSMGDLIQLFFGDSGRLNHLHDPLQRFVGEIILRGAAPSETNMDRAIDEIISDLDPHLLASAGNASVHDGIDYVNTVHNFIRHRLHDIFNLILNHREQSSFGSVLVSLLRHTLGEFVALSLHCFSDGAHGLERLVESRVQSIMSGMNPSIQAWSVNTSIMQLRSMMSHLTITDDHIRRYIVSPDEGRRMGEARQNRMSPCSSAPGPLPGREAETERKTKEKNDQRKSSAENCVEVRCKMSSQRRKRGRSDTNEMISHAAAMDVDEVGGLEEVTTSTTNSGEAVANNEPPIAVSVGSQSWHSAVPQDWVPVITRDVERQRHGVPDTNLSDGYLCGVPLKRRKIATQNKPHGSVQHVFQETLRQSLRNSGVNRNLVESVAGEVSNELGSSFATHVRCTLRQELEGNKDFKPEKFPKSEQKIRRK